MSKPNPCTSCGACCAAYRVSFHWSEIVRTEPEGVPEELTVDLDLHRKAMLGTQSRPPRCIALAGAVGQIASCLIYDRRPGPCRALEPSFWNGQPSEKCDRARATHGLVPLTVSDWEIDDHPTAGRPPLPRVA